MSKISFRTQARALGRWVEEIHAKQPDDLVIVYFDGPWILEVTPGGHVNPRANMLTDWKILGLRVRDLVAWLLKQEGFNGLEGLGDNFEWRLYRGAY